MKYELVLTVVKGLIYSSHVIFSLLPGVDGSRILDVGCGPTIHSVIPASRYFSQIYLADYAACNRQALNDWINRRPVAHEWAPFFKLWAQEEG